MKFFIFVLAALASGSRTDLASRIVETVSDYRKWFAKTAKASFTDYMVNRSKSLDEVLTKLETAGADEELFTEAAGEALEHMQRVAVDTGATEGLSRERINSVEFRSLKRQMGALVERYAEVCEIEV